MGCSGRRRKIAASDEHWTNPSDNRNSVRTIPHTRGLVESIEAFVQSTNLGSAIEEARRLMDIRFLREGSLEERIADIQCVALQVMHSHDTEKQPNACAPCHRRKDSMKINTNSLLETTNN